LTAPDRQTDRHRDMDTDRQRDIDTYRQTDRHSYLVILLTRIPHLDCT